MRPPVISLLALVWVLVVTGAVLFAATAAEAADATVRLTTRATPSALTVGVGDAVTIRNDDDARHRLRARAPEDVDTSNLDPGEQAVVTFPVPGRYVLVDERSEDPAYELTVDVRGAAGSAPADGAAAPAGRSASVSDDAGASPGGTAGGGSGAPRTATVTIPDDVFSPRSVTIATGGTVTWENRDGSHTVTARDRSWDSGVFDDGGRYERRFPDPGTHAYLCLLHPEMTGTVEVVGASTGGSAAGSVSGGTPARATAPPSGPAVEPTSSLRPTPSAAPSGPPGSGARHELRIADFAYAPARLSVAVGDTLTWVNEDAAPHTVTSAGGGPLGSDTLATGDRYEVVVEEAGTLDYRCALHPEMGAEVVVTADAAALADGADPGTARASTTSPEGGGSLPLVAAIMLLFMGVTFTIGRVSAR